MGRRFVSYGECPHIDKSHPLVTNPNPPKCVLKIWVLSYMGRDLSNMGWVGVCQIWAQDLSHMGGTEGRNWFFGICQIWVGFCQIWVGSGFVRYGRQDLSHMGGTEVRNWFFGICRIWVGFCKIWVGFCHLWGVSR